MSTIEASPSAGSRQPAPAHVRRPSTLTAYRWELRKLVSQKRTYLGLGLAVILPLIFVVFQNVHQRGGHGQDNLFARQITQSGLATPVLMLLFLSAFMLPLIAALVAGDIVAAEDGNGTLKTILTRSVDRGQVFAAKALAAMTYARARGLPRRPPWPRSRAWPRGASTTIITFSGTVVSAPKACCWYSPPTPAT